MVRADHRVVWARVARFAGRSELARLLQTSPRLLAHVAPTVTAFAMWSSLRWRERRVTHAAVAAVARRFPNLRAVSLRGCRYVPEAALALADCRALTAVDVSDCRVTACGLVVLAAACPRLAAWNLADSDVDDHGVAALAHACTRLRRLELGGCARVSDVGVLAVARSRGATLRHLDLGWRVPRVSAAAAAAVAAACPALEWVDLCGLGSLDAAAVLAFEAHCPRLPRWVLANLVFSLDRADFERLCARFGLATPRWTWALETPRPSALPLARLPSG